jgi:hypothetical protein
MKPAEINYLIWIVEQYATENNLYIDKWAGILDDFRLLCITYTKDYNYIVLEGTNLNPDCIVNIRIYSSLVYFTNNRFHIIDTIINARKYTIKDLLNE